MRHALKCEPAFFEAMRTSAKAFEVRADDRDYQVGDILEEQEFNPATDPHPHGQYTGRVDEYVVTYVMRGPTGWGFPKGWVVMGIFSCITGRRL